MVYCGKMNKGIVERLQRLGVNAVGLSGLDGRIFEGRHKDSVRAVENGKVKVLRGDHTGTVERVNTHLIDLLLAGGTCRSSRRPPVPTTVWRSTWTATAPPPRWRSR